MNDELELDVFEIGHRVACVDAGSESYGRVGTVMGIDESHQDTIYLVEFDGGSSDVLHADQLADLAQRQVDALYEESEYANQNPILVNNCYIYQPRSQSQPYRGETVKVIYPPMSDGLYTCIVLRDGVEIEAYAHELDELPEPEVIKSRSHLDLFLEFAKAAGLWVREADGQGYHRRLVMSQAPTHSQETHLFFIADNGNFDYMTIKYDDRKLRTVSYEEAYPNILD